MRCGAHGLVGWWIVVVRRWFRKVGGVLEEVGFGVGFGRGGVVGLVGSTVDEIVDLGVQGV